MHRHRGRAASGLRRFEILYPVEALIPDEAVPSSRGPSFTVRAPPGRPLRHRPVRLRRRRAAGPRAGRLARARAGARAPRARRSRRPRGASSRRRRRTRSRRSAGCATAAGVILGHVARRSRITVHGDYDVDGICSTAILVRALRTLGADVDWYLPSRIDDGYGLAAATVERLAARGTDLLVTVDCAITAVDEVAAARAAGMDVVVTDHHTPARRRRAARRADRAPADRRLPVPGPVRGRASPTSSPRRCWPARGRTRRPPTRTSTSSRSPPSPTSSRSRARTAGSCAPGLRELAGTRKPGLQALMDVARVDPSGVDEGAIGFRLAPRLNAAGRLYRADAGLELLLTERPRARPRRSPPSSTPSTPSAATSRRASASRPRRCWPSRARPARRAHVLAAEGWHPGVIGIVAARIAERHYRPTVLIALDGDEGTGSGRSIPGFDLLAGLDRRLRRAAALRRPPRRRRPARSPRNRVEAFREAFVAHAAAHAHARRTSSRTERIDAVAPGDALAPRARRGARAPRAVRHGQPRPSPCSSPPRCSTTRGRWGRAATSRSRSPPAAPARAACAFGAGSSLPAEPGEPVDAAVRLEVNRYNGATEPRLILRSAQPLRAEPIDVIGEPAWNTGFESGARRDSTGTGGEPDPRNSRPADGVRRPTRGRGSTPGPCRAVGRRGIGVAGLLGDLVASGEPTSSSSPPTRRTAHARCSGRVGGFALASWHAARGRPRPGGGRSPTSSRSTRPRAPGARTSAWPGLDPPGLGRA